MYLVRASKLGTTSGYFANEYGYNNPTYNMPNCTDLCLKRSSEIANKGVKTEMFGTGATGNAKDWYKNCKWENGDKIEVGCIVDYDGTYGHVLIVEDILERYSDTHCKCLISQSNYREKKSYEDANWYQSLEYDIEIGVKTKGVGLIPVKCIYNPYVNDKRTSLNGKHQIEITYDRMKARDDNGEWYEGRYIPKGIYNVIKKQEKEIDGVKYQCCKLDDNVWVALVDGCYVEHLKDVDYETLYKELKEKVDNFIGEVNG